MQGVKMELLQFGILINNKQYMFKVHIQMKLQNFNGLKVKEF